MVLIAIAWLYVVFMVAVVEATGSKGTVFGALVTFVLYGILPLSIVAYLFFSPARRRARRATEATAIANPAEAESRVEPGEPLAATRPEETSASAPGAAVDPDSGHHPAGDTVAAVRKEP